MNDWLSIISLVVAIGAVAFAFVTRRQPVTAANVVAAVESVQPLAIEVDKAATIVVQSYEQARRKNKLENTPGLNEVMNRVRSWLPKEVRLNVTNEQIIEAINSAILIASAATAQIAANKAVVADANPGATVDPSSYRLPLDR